MTQSIAFTVYCRPQPQGSAKAFYVKSLGRAVITSDNAKLKPFRQQVTEVALSTVAGLGLIAPVAGKHIPVRIKIDFFLARPASVSKKRADPTVKPDVDKLCRSVLDALTGVLFLDDAQVVEMAAMKHYDGIERVEIVAQS